jgi:O-antigen ligase
MFPVTARPARSDAWTVLAPAALLGTGLLVGAIGPSHPLWAFAGTLALALGLLVVARVDLLPVLLTLTMFVESLSLGGGLRIDRLAGGLAILALLYVALRRGRLLDGIQPNALLVVVGCYGAWMLLSAYWASASSAVFSEFVSYGLSVAYMLTFAVLVRSPRALLWIVAALACGALVFGLVALVSYLVTHGAVRSSGLQGDPNFFAEYQVVALPATLVLAALARRPGVRLVSYAIVAVIVLSIVSSLSRGGLVALVVCIVPTAVLPWRTLFGTRRQKRVYVWTILVALLVTIVVGSGTFLHRVGTIFHPNSGADRGSGRLDLWSSAWRVWKDHPWLGIGGWNFRAHSLDYLQATPGVNTAAHYVTAGREVHNAYLETLTELGPVGLVLFTSIILLTGWYLLTAYRRAREVDDEVLRRVSAALVISLVAVAVSAIFLSSELGRALWILVGLALATDAMSRARHRHGTAPVPPT